MHLIAEQLFGIFAVVEVYFPFIIFLFLFAALSECFSKIIRVFLAYFFGKLLINAKQAPIGCIHIFQLNQCRLHVFFLCSGAVFVPADGEQRIVDVGLYGSDVLVIIGCTCRQIEMFPLGLCIQLLGFLLIRFQDGLSALIAGRNFMGNKVGCRREIVFLTFRKCKKPGGIAVIRQFVKRFFVFVGNHSKQIGNIHPIQQSLKIDDEQLVVAITFNVR